MPNISAIQAELRAVKLDGWLFCDHHHRDAIAARVLGLSMDGLVSRRWFYFIPAKGEPRMLLHRIEQGTLDGLPGKKLVYAGWEELHKNLRKILAGATKIAMQYSPQNNIPYIGLVDAGTIELIRSMKKKIFTSGDLVQRFEAAWSPEQLESHIAAGHIVDRVRQEAFEHAARCVRESQRLTERDLAQWIVARYREAGLTEELPIVGVQPNNGNPHYEPKPGSSRVIRAGDLLLLDMWGKLRKPGAVYYDITWMGYLGARVPGSYAKLFTVVREARDGAIAFIQESVAKGKTIHGFEVDRVARGVIQKAGYAKYFVHRTGHSIGEAIHGNGANMDGLETRDDRKIVPRTCFSIEPGIYLPDFGLRTEVNVYVSERDARVTGAIQHEILPLLP